MAYDLQFAPSGAIAWADTSEIAWNATPKVEVLSSWHIQKLLQQRLDWHIANAVGADSSYWISNTLSLDSEWTLGSAYDISFDSEWNLGFDVRFGFDSQWLIKNSAQKDFVYRILHGQSMDADWRILNSADLDSLYHIWLQVSKDFNWLIYHPPLARDFQWRIVRDRDPDWLTTNKYRYQHPVIQAFKVNRSHKANKGA